MIVHGSRYTISSQSWVCFLRVVCLSDLTASWHDLHLGDRKQIPQPRQHVLRHGPLLSPFRVSGGYPALIISEASWRSLRGRRNIRGMHWWDFPGLLLICSWGSKWWGWKKNKLRWQARREALLLACRDRMSSTSAICLLFTTLTWCCAVTRCSVLCTLSLRASLGPTYVSKGNSSGIGGNWSEGGAHFLSLAALHLIPSSTICRRVRYLFDNWVNLRM